jgi:hypothetical protein
MIRREWQSEIWGSHGGEDTDVGLFGCDAVWTWALKMETECSLRNVGIYLQVHTAMETHGHWLAVFVLAVMHSSLLRNSQNWMYFYKRAQLDFPIPPPPTH